MKSELWKMFLPPSGFSHFGSFSAYQTFLLFFLMWWKQERRQRRAYPIKPNVLLGFSWQSHTEARKHDGLAFLHPVGSAASVVMETHPSHPNTHTHTNTKHSRTSAALWYQMSFQISLLSFFSSPLRSCMG